MSNEDARVVEGMMLSVQAILKEASVRLSRGGGIVGSSQDQARIELATAAQAIEMTRFWIAKAEHSHTDAGEPIKLKFGDLELGDHFICWPVPGDNSRHGGYLGAQRLFVKTGELTANNGSGVESSLGGCMDVIKVSKD